MPVRQWVLSLPYRVRHVCAYDADKCAVASVQRFDSGLWLNLHFHVLWADGVFAHELREGRVEFCEHAELTERAGAWDQRVGRGTRNEPFVKGPLCAEIEVFVCPRCGGPRRLLSAIQDPESIRRVLGSLGLSAEVPVLAGARSPPRQGELEFDGSHPARLLVIGLQHPRWVVTA